MTARSLPAQYFDALYDADPDPWRFATSEYEREKYADTIDALPQARVGSLLEVGCSIGVLTAQLARRCDRILAVDVAEAALARARRRCAKFRGVRFARMQAPDEWPSESFDLILFSEILYYLVPTDIERAATRALASLKPGGTVLLVHWTGPTDYPCGGDQAAEIFMRTTALALQADRSTRRAEYRLDRLRAG